jgi:MEMO1 family protein
MTEHNTDRAAAVAGRFYPSDPDTLINDIEMMFQKAEKHTKAEISEEEDLMAIIVPHAGYVFSGVVAASAYNIVRTKENIERIFIIGSSHHASFHGASIYHRGNYHTPLGTVEVDKDVANKLLDNSSLFQFIPEVHIPEHTVEVQLPFLQYIFGAKFKMVPIIIGTMSIEVCGEIAESLRPFFSPNNLFIISTDLSHYPDYNDAVKIDHNTISELCNNNPKTFLDYLHETDKKHIQNLMTSMCGWTSVLTLLYLTSENKMIQYSPVLYQNSGDIPIYGEKSRVVGYQSIAVMQRKARSSGFDNFTNEHHSNTQDKSGTLYSNEIDEKHLDDQTEGISAFCSSDKIIV